VQPRLPVQPSQNVEPRQPVPEQEGTQRQQAEVVLAAPDPVVQAGPARVLRSRMTRAQREFEQNFPTRISPRKKPFEGYKY